MKYFREEENPTARLPANFMQSFLEACGLHHPLAQVAKKMQGRN